MDFIKIPYYYNEDRVGDIVIRISEIKLVANCKHYEEDCSAVKLGNGKVVYSPMRVAEIYDLIKQNTNNNETSN